MRNQAIDNYRGLAILLVVLAHVTFVSPLLNEFIYSFLMTAFFMLSGYLFNPEKAQRSPRSYIQGKFYRLVIPAWVMGMLCGLPYLFFYVSGIGHVDTTQFFTRLIGTLVGYPVRDYNFNCDPLWFLFCLFTLEALATLVVYRYSGCYKAVFFAIGVFGLLLSAVTDIYIPFNVHVALFAFLYFSLGCYLRRFDLFDIALNKRHAGAFLLAFCIWAYMIYLSHDKFLIAEGHIGSGWNLLYNLISSFCGTYVLYYVARLLRSSRALAWLGVHTLPLLGFNYMADFAVYKVLMHFSIYSWPLSFLLQLIVFIPFVALLDKLGFLGRLINGKVGPRKVPNPVMSEADKSVS